MQIETQATSSEHQYTKDDFFHIELKLLQDRSIFPFHLWVYHPISKTYSPFLWGNDPLISSKRRLLEMVYKVGGGIAIKLNQKVTFLSSLELKEEDVPSLCPKDVDPLIWQQRSQKAKLKAEMEQESLLDGNPANNSVKASALRLKKTLESSLEKDDLSSLIKMVANEISTFPVTHSHTVSLARFLASELLLEDNATNRVVALSYLMAKLMSLGDPDSLSELVCAAYFHHLGIMQVESSLILKPQLHQSEEERKRFRHHPGLCQHLLKKAQVDIPPQVFELILDHHESYSGHGYPLNKKGDHLNPRSLILGSVSHLVEYSQGLIDGKKTPLKALLSKIRANPEASSSGLETDFGPAVIECLMSLLNKNVENENSDGTLSQEKVAA